MTANEGDHAMSDDNGSNDRAAALDKRHLFFAGALGTVAVYCAFAVRNGDVVREQLSSDPVHAGLATSMLLVLAGIAGFLVRISGPQSYKAAFVMGMGLPALIFAADIGPTESPRPDATPPSVREPADSAGPLPQVTRQPSHFDSVRMVLSPVSAVSRYRQEETIDGIDRRLLAIAADTQAEPELRESAVTIREELRTPVMMREPVTLPFRASPPPADDE
jgi:hypothetical protein